MGRLFKCQLFSYRIDISSIPTYRRLSHYIYRERERERESCVVVSISLTNHDGTVGGDEVLDADQQLRIANQVRAQFDSMAPKRPTKPNRSESDSTPTSPLHDQNASVPEFDRLRSLQSQSQSLDLFSGSDCVDQDEFVETQYYTELASIDKQHHTTGSGFIKVERERCEAAYDLQLQRDCENGVQRQMVFRTNPATNDWIPSVEDNQVVHVSSKPNRSESC